MQTETENKIFVPTVIDLDITSKDIDDFISETLAQKIGTSSDFATWTKAYQNSEAGKRGLQASQVMNQPVGLDLTLMAAESVAFAQGVLFALNVLNGRDKVAHETDSNDTVLEPDFGC